MDDKLIIKYIKKRKQKGLELLIDTYSGLVASIVRKNLRELAIYEEECISDVFLAIWDNIEYFDQNKNTFKNWICAISKYKAINYKKKYLFQSNLSAIKDDLYYIDKNLLRLEIKEELEDMFQHLSKRDREIFFKYYVNEESAEKLAIENNLCISSLYSRLSRGRKKIRESLTKQEN